MLIFRGESVGGIDDSRIPQLFPWLPLQADGFFLEGLQGFCQVFLSMDSNDYNDNQTSINNNLSSLRLDIKLYPPCVPVP